MEEIRKSQKEVETTLKEWGLLTDAEDLTFYNTIKSMSMNLKLMLFGFSFMEAVTTDVYEDFATFKLREEADLRTRIAEKDDKRLKILIADTYLRSKKGQKKLTRYFNFGVDE